MSPLQSLLHRVEGEAQPTRFEEVYDVLAHVPWARESLEAYVAGHRPDLENDVLACIWELLAA